MEIYYSQLNNDIRYIKLRGKLDIMGTSEVNPKFTEYCSGDNIRVVVDLSEVDFLSSIGIRFLVTMAKSVASRKGKMVLLNPMPEVNHLLEITGIPAIIPSYSHFESAETILMAP